MGKKRRAQADLTSKAFYGKDGEPKTYRQQLDEKNIANHLSRNQRRRSGGGDAEDSDDEFDDSAAHVDQKLLGGRRSGGRSISFGTPDGGPATSLAQSRRAGSVGGGSRSRYCLGRRPCRRDRIDHSKVVRGGGTGAVSLRPRKMGPCRTSRAEKRRTVAPRWLAGVIGGCLLAHGSCVTLEGVLLVKRELPFLVASYGVGGLIVARVSRAIARAGPTLGNVWMMLTVYQFARAALFAARVFWPEPVSATSGDPGSG